MNKLSRKGRIFIILLSVMLILTCLLPLVFVVQNASKTRDEYTASKFALPESFTLPEKFAKLFRANFDRYILNTVIVVTIGISISLTFCSMAGYALDKLQLPKRNLIYLGIVSMLAIPYQAFIVPLFAMCANWNLINNLFAMGIIQGTLQLAFGTFLMRSFYHGIPNELMDSAKIDGANSFQVYYKIMLPLGKSALITLATLNFFGIWNELFISMIFLRNSKVRVVTPAVAALQVSTKGGKVTDWPLLFSGILLAIIVPLIVYVITHNRLSKGITMGALKY